MTKYEVGDIFSINFDSVVTTKHINVSSGDYFLVLKSDPKFMELVHLRTNSIIKVDAAFSNAK